MPFEHGSNTDTASLLAAAEAALAAAITDDGAALATLESASAAYNLTQAARRAAETNVNTLRGAWRLSQTGPAWELVLDAQNSLAAAVTDDQIALATFESANAEYVATQAARRAAETAVNDAREAGRSQAVPEPDFGISAYETIDLIQLENS